MGLFDWEELSERFEEEFEGVVIDARLPCDCALCLKGKEKLESTGRLRKEVTQLHIVIAPLDEDRPLRHVFIDTTAKVRYSRRGVWALALKWLNIQVSDVNDLLNKMYGKVFIFKRTAVGDALNYYGVNVRKSDALKNALEADVIFPVSMILEGEYAVRGIDVNWLNEYINDRKEEWENIKAGRGTTEENVSDSLNDIQFL